MSHLRINFALLVFMQILLQSEPITVFSGSFKAVVSIPVDHFMITSVTDKNVSGEREKKKERKKRSLKFGYFNNTLLSSVGQWRENMTVTACDFWHFVSIVSISDVMSKTGICGKTVKYVTSQSFSAPRWQRANQHECTPGGLSNSTHNCCCCVCFFVFVF